MQAALIVARELLRCRLVEGGRDALLERVAELLDAACRGAAPFCTLPTSQAVAGACAGPHHARSPPMEHLRDPRTPNRSAAPLVLPRL